MGRACTGIYVMLLMGNEMVSRVRGMRSMKKSEIEIERKESCSLVPALSKKERQREKEGGCSDD